MKIILGTSSLTKNSNSIEICFNENTKFYSSVVRSNNIDPGIKTYIENNFEYIVQLWNRFIRFKSFKQSDLFYYSSPIISGLGYPPSSIISLGIILYVKIHRNKNIIIHTQRKELIAYYTKKYLNLIKIKNVFIPFSTFGFILKYLISKIMLKSMDSNRPKIIIHSHHQSSFFSGGNYITSKFPDISQVTSCNGFDLLYDINPNYFHLHEIFKFRKYGCVTSPICIGFFELLSIYFISIIYWAKNLFLFKAFFLSETNVYSTIFYNILKRRSITKLIKKLPARSYYIMPWENRGYQLGIEKDLEGEKIIQYSCGIILKTGTEYVNYRYLLHCKFGLDVTMSNHVSDFLTKLNPNRRYNIIIKSPRVFNISVTANSRNNNILVICPMDSNITNNLLNLLKGKNDYNVKYKFHPYYRPEVDENIIEERTLSECVKDYSIAIYSGITSAILEVYLAGLNVFKLYNLNGLTFDVMDDFKVKEIKTIKDVTESESDTSITPYLKNYYLGVSEKDFNDYINELTRN